MTMTHHSWVTQRMANRLPLWTDARSCPHSILQQYLNPAGEALEDLYGYIINENRNHFLTTANLDQLDVIYSVVMPNVYEFGTDRRNLDNPAYVAPRVTATIDGVETDIALAENNSLDSFHYNAIPTRVIDPSETISTATTIVPATTLADLEAYTPNSIGLATRLIVTVAGCEEFVNTKRRMPSSFLVLEGTTARGIEESETIYISYNGVFVTKKIWSELTGIQFFGLSPDTGTIQVDLFHFSKGREVDKYMLSVDASSEKLLYHRVVAKEFGATPGSVHQHLRVSANTIADLYKGIDTLEVMKEIELGWDNAGVFTDVVLNDIAIQPFTGRVFGVDDTHLYVFEPFASHADLKGMQSSTGGAEMIVSTDFTDYVLNDTIEFEPYWRRPTKRVYRNRWTITEPDGTMYHLDLDGNHVDVGTERDGWIGNELYTELVFGPFKNSLGAEIDKQRFSFTLDQRGTWKIKLEVDLEDGVREVDMLPIQVHYKTAIARIALPATLPTGQFTGIAFDSDQKLWLYNPYKEAAYRVDLATDNMFIDFENKTIYFHEDYSDVLVYSSDNVVD